MAKPRLRVVRRSTVNRTVTPRRRPNRDLRTREHLTPKEVDRLIEGTKGNRWAHRDATMVLLAYRHGLRAAELIDLRWEQVDLSHAVLHVRRVKSGTPSTHPLTGRELRALRRLQRDVGHRSPPQGSPGCWNARPLWRVLRSRLTRICCVTLAASSSLTMEWILGRSKPTWATRTSSTRFVTPSWPQRGSRTSGGTERAC
jgi:integrase